MICSTNYEASPQAKLRHQQQGGVCFICGNPLSVRLCTKDHFWPKAAGGAKGWANCVLTHEHCNSRKADSTPSVREISRFVTVTGHAPALRRGTLARLKKRRPDLAAAMEPGK